MRLDHLFRAKVPDGPTRPTHFRETQEERTEETPPSDYPTGVEGDYKIDTANDYGYQHRPEEQQPVGVYLATPIPVARPIIEWSSATITVGLTGGTQIASADRRRHRFIVRNLDAANTVYLMREQVNQNFTGYAIGPGREVEFTHCSAMWARADTAACIISYFSEFELEENVNHG